jgi:DNA-binding cell septation regulator SpoVG
LKEREEGLSRYWMILRKINILEFEKGNEIAMFEKKLSSEEFMDQIIDNFVMGFLTEN